MSVSYTCAHDHHDTEEQEFVRTGSTEDWLWFIDSIKSNCRDALPISLLPASSPAFNVNGRSSFDDHDVAAVTPQREIVPCGGGSASPVSLLMCPIESGCGWSTGYCHGDDSVADATPQYNYLARGDGSGSASPRPLWVKAGSPPVDGLHSDGCRDLAVVTPLKNIMPEYDDDISIDMDTSLIDFSDFDMDAIALDVHRPTPSCMPCGAASDAEFDTAVDMAGTDSAPVSYSNITPMTLSTNLNASAFESVAPPVAPPAKRRRVSSEPPLPRENSNGTNGILRMLRDTDEDKVNKLYFFVSKHILEAASLPELYKGVDVAQFNNNQKYIKAKRNSVTKGLHFVCRFCRANNNAHVDLMSSVCSSVRTRLIYRRLPRFIAKHVRGECESIPDDIKEKVDTLVRENVRTNRAKKGEKEFDACVRANGFRDKEGVGIQYYPGRVVAPGE